jgi:hypothetical protein
VGQDGLWNRMAPSSTPPQTKAECVDMVKTDGPASYVVRLEAAPLLAALKARFDEMLYQVSGKLGLDAQTFSRCLMSFSSGWRR